jgi:hypothetical protein
MCQIKILRVLYVLVNQICSTKMFVPNYVPLHFTVYIHQFHKFYNIYIIHIEGDVWLSREMGGKVGRWVANQGDGWLSMQLGG